MTSEATEKASAGERKALERRAFLRRFGTAAAAAPAAMVLLSSRQGAAFSNGGNKGGRRGSAGLGFSG